MPDVPRASPWGQAVPPSWQHVPEPGGLSIGAQDQLHGNYFEIGILENPNFSSPFSGQYIPRPTPITLPTNRSSGEKTDRFRKKTVTVPWRKIGTSRQFNRLRHKKQKFSDILDARVDPLYDDRANEHLSPSIEGLVQWTRTRPHDRKIMGSSPGEYTVTNLV